MNQLMAELRGAIRQMEQLYSIVQDLRRQVEALKQQLRDLQGK